MKMLISSKDVILNISNSVSAVQCVQANQMKTACVRLVPAWICPKMGQSFRLRIPKRCQTLIAIVVAMILLHMMMQTCDFAHDEGSAQVQLEAEWFRVKSTLDESQIRRLPDLKTINWPTPSVSAFPAGMIQANRERMSLPDAFEPIMSTGEIRLFRRLLKTFADVMFTNGLGDRFMLTAGTLAGSFHHHDFIPWDDEIDILVDIEVQGKVRTLLKSLEPEYVLHTGRYRDKFFARETNVSKYSADVELSKKVPRFRWNWPFLDLPYYVLNQTHLSELGPSYVKEISWPKRIVFPLYLRPFGSAWLPAPKNPLAFLRTRYGEGNTCKVIGYSHVLEGSGPSGVTKCELLALRYPFVAHGPCERIDGFHSKDQILLNEERLLLYAGYSNSTLIHSLCLAASLENARASTFYYNQAS